MSRRAGPGWAALLLGLGAFLTGFNLWAYLAFSRMTAAVDSVSFPLPVRFYTTLSPYLFSDPIQASLGTMYLIRGQIAAGLLLIGAALVVLFLSRARSRT